MAHFQVYIDCILTKLSYKVDSARNYDMNGNKKTIIIWLLASKETVIAVPKAAVKTIKAVKGFVKEFVKELWSN